MNRRHFNQALVALALSGLASNIRLANAVTRGAGKSSMFGFGPLLDDPKGILDLPAGFSYKVISTFGKPMSDGLTVPDRADGMGCFGLDNDRVALVRNHEISPNKSGKSELSMPNFIGSQSAMKERIQTHCYATDSNSVPLAGGTSHLIYNLKTQTLENEFMSLIGTVRNCAGGMTPWQSWLSCEESVLNQSNKGGKEHGYVFEVPADVKGLVKAEPLKSMGRFNHEAACVDPSSGIVYLTEDRNDSLFYRFIPNQAGKLAAGGQLQALAVKGSAQFDTRNWRSATMKVNEKLECEWLDLDDVESPLDDLRQRGHEKGAALFARGEGIHFGDKEMYFCCTNGGNKKLGQIMLYTPSSHEGKAGEKNQPGRLSLFVESENKSTFNYGDNITIAPSGDLLVCEDQYTDIVDNHLKGVTPEGALYDFARVRWQTEPAGVCFSPDGSTLFVNLYSPTATLAITGPWLKA